MINWSPDSKHFAMVDTDSRKVKDSGVNSIAEPATLKPINTRCREKEGPSITCWLLI